MKVETFVRGPLLNNVYLLWDETAKTRPSSIPL